ncbi:MAG: hypothetical protein GX801_04930 [Fibrobacter sp.]|nr:hypothetical protein [Fibrobacter sp.]
MKNKIKWILIIVLLGACAKTNVTKYYMLDYVPEPTPERLAKGAWPVSVRIREFAIAEAYRRNQMVYRQSAHELRFYNYELWAVNPEYLVSDMIYKHIRDVKLFRELTRSVGAEESDYVLRGEITALEEYDSETHWYAHIALSMQLQETQSQSVVWARTWDYRKKVAQQEPVYVVRELSTLLEKIVDEAIADLDSLMESNFNANIQDKTSPQIISPLTVPEPCPSEESDSVESDVLPVPEELPPPEDI